MGEHYRLLWAARKQTRPTRTIAAGEAVARWFETYMETCIRPLQELEAIIAPLGDERFHRHCRVASVNGSTLHVAVNDPSMVSEMRNLWAERIRQEIGRTLRVRSIRNVMFEYGASPPPRTQVSKSPTSPEGDAGQRP